MMDPICNFFVFCLLMFSSYIISNCFVVYAKNIVGNSEYSDWNSVENSYTKTAAPEQPMNPIAVDGTWESITLQIRVPFNNGSNINKMYVEQRLIEPFAKGDWRPAGNRYYHIPDEVSIVEAVDTVEQQREVEAMVRKLEDLKMSSGFNPYGKDRDKLDKEIEDLIEKQVSIQELFLIGESISNSIVVTAINPYFVLTSN